MADASDTPALESTQVPGRTSGIYEIVNLRNGKRYIGSAVDIRARWRGHRHDLSGGHHHSRALQRAWMKYGDQCFSFRLLETCGRAALISVEQRYLDDLEPEYNCCRVAGSNLGVKRSAESRAKQGASRKGMVLSEAHRLAIGASLLGKPRSLEAIYKTRLARTGMPLGPMSDAHKAAIAKSHSGRRLTPEHANAISRGKIGKKRPDMMGNRFGSREKSEAERAKLSAALKGKKKSPDTVARMRLAWIKRKANAEARRGSNEQSLLSHYSEGI